MAQFRFIALIAAILFFSAFTFNSSISWSIDKNHSIKFSTNKALGDFQDFKGETQFDEENLHNSKFDIQVDVKSIRTGNWLKKTSMQKAKTGLTPKSIPRLNSLLIASERQLAGMK